MNKMKNYVKTPNDILNEIKAEEIDNRIALLLSTDPDNSEALSEAREEGRKLIRDAVSDCNKFHKINNFSQTYYGHLNRDEAQHKVNNAWFKGCLISAQNSGKNGLYIPELNTFFNFEGEPVFVDFVSGRGVA